MTPSQSGARLAAAVATAALALLLAPARLAGGAWAMAADGAVAVEVEVTQAEVSPAAKGVVKAEPDAPQPAAPPPDPTPADDAYHLAAWRDARHDALYTEWWYFNVHDARAGVDAIFSYFVTNPLDIGGIGRTQMVAVADTPQGGVVALDLYPAAAFSADDRQADVTIDPGAAVAGAADGAGGAPAPVSTVRVAAGGRYLISGASRDGRLAWDLAYAPASEPWFAGDRMPVGRLAWERMSWLVFMPRARVTGTLTLDGRAIAIDATGYHDHNWGEWIPTDALWNWAQFSSPRLSLEMGDFIGKPIGVVALDLDGERTVFTPDQYSLVHTRWAWDRVNRLFYPSESVLSADNGTLRMQVTMRALKTAPLRGDLPAPLRDVIIYEQAAGYEGMVWGRGAGSEADANGAEGDAPEEWHLRAPVRGTAFKEWTGKRY